MVRRIIEEALGRPLGDGQVLSTSSSVARVRFRSAEKLLSASAEHIYLCDRKGRLSYANRAAALAWGVEGSELLGRGFRELEPGSETLERLASDCEQVLHSGRLLRDRTALRLGRGERDYEGEFIPLVDEAGTVDGVVTTLWDVTEEERQGRIRGFLVQAYQLLRTCPNPPLPLGRLVALAVEDLADLCVLASYERGRVDWVEVAQRGGPVSAAFREELRTRAFGSADASVLARVAATGASEVVSHARDARAMALYPDQLGLRRWQGRARESYACVPLLSSGDVRGVLLLVTQGACRQLLPRDLDSLSNLGAHLGERLARERANQGESRAMEMLGVASHEIRTPLTLMKLQVDRLLRESRETEGLGTRAQPRLESIASQLSRVSRLVEELLDAARVQNRGVELQLEPLDLVALLRSLCVAFTDSLAAAGCELSVVLPDHPVWVRCDRSRIEQMVSNLLANAGKYAPGAPVTLTLRQEGGEVELSVQDRGPGIPPSEHRRIFERFERAEGAEARKGFGLGLWLVRQLAEAHGGRAAVESTYGQGARFYIRLPGSAGTQAPQEQLG